MYFYAKHYVLAYHPPIIRRVHQELGTPLKHMLLQHESLRFDAAVYSKKRVETTVNLNVGHLYPPDVLS